jgi:Uma2 family endonuclease
MVDHIPQINHPVFCHGQKMTVDEYFQLPETNIHAELIVGILHVYDGQEGNMPAPTPQHQEILMSILAYLLPITTKKGLFKAPIDVLLGDVVVQPDILWVSPQNAHCEITNRCMIDTPVLIIEILSPSTHKQDRVAKFDIYEAHGVGEYWIVDPDVQIIEVYIRQDDRLRRQGGYTRGDRFTSRTLNNAQIDVPVLLG